MSQTSTEKDKSQQAVTIGIHHLALTVRDLATTLNFFEQTLGYKKVGEVPEYPAAFVSDGQIMIALFQAENPPEAINFDRKSNIGLHHFSLILPSLEELDQLNSKLSATEGVAVEFPPEDLHGGPTKHMMCTEPGGIHIEFIVPAKS